MTNSALVLSGGGVAGIAWELGILQGLAEVTPETAASVLAETTTFVGTSAGSSVAAQIAGGTPLADLYAAQLADPTNELSVDVDLQEFGLMMMEALSSGSTPEEGRQRLGAIALAVDSVPASERRAVIASRLPNHEWPSRRMLITAVDADSGELRVFDRDSGVGLVDAVGASCAVPGIWPTVEIDGRHYMDGGARSIANADLAAGAEQVLILTPGAEESPLGPALSPSELAVLAPARIFAVYADDASLAAFGSNPLDPSIRAASAEAGLAQGRAIAAQIADFWR
jgi:NTE family protein